MYKVVITPSAKADFKEIFTVIGIYSPAYARQYQKKFSTFLKSNLSANPKLGREYNMANGLRRLVYDARFNVYYLIEDKAVYILHILDGRQSYSQRLADPDVDLPPSIK